MFSGRILVVLAAVAAPNAVDERVCRTEDARVVVGLDAHVLTLCAAGVVVTSFGVRLGRGGTGKTTKGDAKTPIGTYSLGQPRRSKRYGTFIPIGFPTARQRDRGYTGGAIGVHGPHRTVRWLGRLVNAFDLSDGCVGVATDAEMDRIAAWVRKARARTIELR